MKLRSLAAAAAFALAAVALPAATGVAAASSYPTAQFSMTYGASYLKGTVTFYNQSANVHYVLHAGSGSGCKSIKVEGWPQDTGLISVNDWPCDGATHVDDIHLNDMFVRGGFRIVHVTLWDKTPSLLRAQQCWVTYPNCSDE